MKRNFIRRSFQCLGLNEFNIGFFRDNILNRLISKDDNNTIYLLSFNIGNKEFIPCTIILIQNIEVNNNYVPDKWKLIYKTIHEYMCSNKINFNNTFNIHIDAISIDFTEKVLTDLRDELYIFMSKHK